MARGTAHSCFGEQHVGQFQGGKICRSHDITDHQHKEIKSFCLSDAALINVLV